MSALLCCHFTIVVMPALRVPNSRASYRRRHEHGGQPAEARLPSDVAMESETKETTMRTRSRSSSRLHKDVHAAWWRVVALVALLAPMIATPATVIAQDAASTPEAGPAYYSDTKGPPQPGGVATFLLYEDPDTLNPLLDQTSIAEHVTNVITEGLAYNDP